MKLDSNNIERVVTSVGFKSTTDFLLKFSLPLIIFSLIFSFVLMKFIHVIPVYVPILTFFGGTVLAFAYPYVKYDSIKRHIQSNLHFFITYAGTIATMEISRASFFRKVAEKTSFGPISDIFKKILYLSKDWNLGFASACRKMSKRTPSKILGDFLDRFAIIMDYGEDLDVFLYDEQKAVLDDYSTEYMKSLEIIKLIQDFFISISVSFAFVFGIALLAPIMMNISLQKIMMMSSAFLIIVDFSLLVAIKNYIPSDSLFTALKKKNFDQKNLFMVFVVSLVIGIIIFIVLMFLFPNLMFLMKFAIAVTPLIIPGVMATNYESVIVKRDTQFPIFARVLGSAIDIRSGAVISSLSSTQVHNFGSLNDLAIKLYKRLKIGSNKFKSWALFSFESGSNLIDNFSRIFSESIYLGGKAEKIGEIVSNNMMKQMSLRKKRWQLADSLKGAFYGSLIGLAATIFVSLSVSERLANLFSVPANVNNQMLSVISNIFPTKTNLDFPLVFFELSILIIVHSLISAWILKAIEGGSNFAILIDFIIMVWIGALAAFFLPDMINQFLPNVSPIWAINSTSVNVTSSVGLS